ncbi:hypothetical protein L249_7513 [Ophiocordyceps polyrhachis-furcata BCC 54312]|uniref:Cytochrome P450 n=1 Tax=Ophiocordyceps polyrhachis-furcata BCC 54312 TaxID=1330021 RepID=A0A367LBN3_9HYPO|nr:hypothetical protein L249_7513 [Ophiocordyceps polyrhachis-furcata BCC 54312]
MSILLRSLSAAALIAFLSLIVSRSWRRKGVVLRLPPGPKPLPLVGNIRDLPPKGVPEFQHWLAHKDIYGPVSSVTVLGQTIVIINNRQAATYLLEHQWLKTSGRPQTTFVDMCGMSHFIACLSYVDDLRRRRKLMLQMLGTERRTEQYHDAMENSSKCFLNWALTSPEKIFKHLENFTGAAILNATYGYSIGTDQEDPLVRLGRSLMIKFSLAVAPGAWPVDFIPALRNLPDGLPGTESNATARRWKKTSQRMVEVPYLFVRNQMKTGCYRPSITSRLLELHGQKELNSQEEDDIKLAAAAQFGGASETTAASLKGFLLAMIRFPDVQRKAQNEIDRVVGTERLPRCQDRANLPYVVNLVKEIFRWSPVAALGLPHTATEDITYGGHLIPKGAILLPNLWWFTHNPEVYSDADSFNPDRYSESLCEPDPTVAFGFGRRACPGRFFAEASVFTIVSQFLSVFNISEAVDQGFGIKAQPQLKALPGIITFPEDFAYSITPRDDTKDKFVQNMMADQPVQSSDASSLDDAVFDRD